MQLLEHLPTSFRRPRMVRDGSSTFQWESSSLVVAGRGCSHTFYGRHPREIVLSLCFGTYAPSPSRYEELTCWGGLPLSGSNIISIDSHY